MSSANMSLSEPGDVSQGGPSGKGPSQNSVLMLSSESFRFMMANCVGSGSCVVVDKRRSGSSKIGMVKGLDLDVNFPWTALLIRK